MSIVVTDFGFFIRLIIAYRYTGIKN